MMSPASLSSIFEHDLKTSMFEKRPDLMSTLSYENRNPRQFGYTLAEYEF